MGVVAVIGTSLMRVGTAVKGGKAVCGALVGVSGRLHGSILSGLVGGVKSPLERMGWKL